jgi:hypothetical protein
MSALPLLLLTKAIRHSASLGEVFAGASLLDPPSPPRVSSTPANVATAVITAATPVRMPGKVVKNAAFRTPSPESSDIGYKPVARSALS